MLFRRHRFLRVARVAAFAAFALASATAAAQSSEPPAGGTGSQPRTPTDPLLPQDGTTAPATTGTPTVDPAGDQAKLLQQGSERPTNDGSIGARPSEVYSEDWWAHTRPIVELHGYFRTRGELYHNFSLGRP